MKYEIGTPNLNRSRKIVAARFDEASWESFRQSVIDIQSADSLTQLQRRWNTAQDVFDSVLLGGIKVKVNYLDSPWHRDVRLEASLGFESQIEVFQYNKDDWRSGGAEIRIFSKPL